MNNHKSLHALVDAVISANNRLKNTQYDLHLASGYVNLTKTTIYNQTTNGTHEQYLSVHDYADESKLNKLVTYINDDKDIELLANSIKD